LLLLIFRLGGYGSYLWFELECPSGLKAVDNDRVLVLDEGMYSIYLVIPLMMMKTLSQIEGYLPKEFNEGVGN